MAETTVDLSRSDRGALFVADEEAIAAGWATDDPYPGMLRLLDEGLPVREGAFDELLGPPPQFAEMLRDRKHYTALSFDAVNQAFMDGETFSALTSMNRAVCLRSLWVDWRLVEPFHDLIDGLDNRNAAALSKTDAGPISHR